MTTSVTSPQPTQANAVVPHFASELSRLTHRRFYRTLTVLLLGGIVVISGIVFFNSSKSQVIPADVQQSYQAQVRQWQRQFPHVVQGWQDCMAHEGSTSACGPKPDEARDGPKITDFYPLKVYVGADKLPAIVIAVSVAGAVLAFILGASTGGAEWSSRSMALQLLWEPRRGRLFSIKWLSLAVVTVATTVVALVIALALGLVSVWLRGAPQIGESGYPPGFFSSLASSAGRGLVLVIIATTFGYALSMLVRNTGAALGVAFVYFAVFENAVRLALQHFGPEPYMLTTNAVAFMIKGGLDVPGKLHTVTDQSGVYTQAVMVHVSNGRALLTMLIYLVIITVPAVWSFMRRDVA